MQGQSLGSPQYMAPEQMSSPDKVDARADVWSLGVVLFELLTGKVPFGGETIPVACVKVLCDEPASLREERPELPAELEAVVRRCLCKQPDERYPSVKELAQALVPFASPECAESLGRVRRILSNARGSDPGRGALRPLPEPPERFSDSTPVPSVRTTTDVEFRVPVRPLWPAALLVAGVASLLIFTRSDPHALWEMTQIAGQRVHSAARVSAHAVAGVASQAADYVVDEVRAKRSELRVPTIGAAQPTDSDRALNAAPPEPAVEVQTPASSAVEVQTPPASSAATTTGVAATGVRPEQKHTQGTSSAEKR
jgi:serine/threonine-protein kinase